MKLFILMLLILPTAFAQAAPSEQEVTALNILARKAILPDATPLTIEELSLPLDPTLKKNVRLDVINNLQGKWQLTYSCSGSPLDLKNSDQRQLYPFAPGSPSERHLVFHIVDSEAIVSRITSYTRKSLTFGKEKTANVSNERYDIEIINSKEFFLISENSTSRMHFVSLRPTGELALEYFDRNDPKCTDGTPVRSLLVKVAQ